MDQNEKTPALLQGFFVTLAERTGLEPATSGVTGQHSNQLNYRSEPRDSTRIRALGKGVRNLFFIVSASMRARPESGRLQGT